MTITAYVSRFLRKYLFSPESLLLLVLVIVLYNSIINVNWFWQNWSRSSGTIKFEANVGAFDGDAEENKNENFRWKEQASWELSKGHAAVYSIRGRRPHMEDRFNFDIDKDKSQTSVFGVFDGHGGEFASDFVEKTLFSNLKKQKTASDAHNNATDLLQKEILRVDEQLLDLVKTKYDISGTTLLVAVLRGHLLTVANVGDSRGVMCDKSGKAIPLSFDHKPNEAKEKQRIQDAGGFVSFNGVWRVAGILATSRALGDYPLKEQNFVIANPDILTFDLRDIQPEFIILATDGLWDVFTNEEAVDYIRERLDEPHFGAKSLVLQAYYRGSLDNITVLVVNLRTFDFRSFP